MPERDRLAYLRDYCRRRRALQKEAGLCATIGCRRPPVPDRAACPECRNKYKVYRYNGVLRRLADARAQKSGSADPVPAPPTEVGGRVWDGGV